MLRAKFWILKKVYTFWSDIYSTVKSVINWFSHRCASFEKELAYVENYISNPVTLYSFGMQYIVLLLNILTEEEHAWLSKYNWLESWDIIYLFWYVFYSTVKFIIKEGPIFDRHSYHDWLESGFVFIHFGIHCFFTKPNAVIKDKLRLHCNWPSHARLRFWWD